MFKIRSEEADYQALLATTPLTVRIKTYYHKIVQ